MLRLVALVVAFVALVGPALADRVTLTGEVTYRERIALPPAGSLNISLVDLANPNPPTVSIGAAIATPGQVPLTFTLSFDESVILPGHDYGLDAQIVGGDGIVRFRTAKPYPVDPLAPVEAISIIVNQAAASVEKAAVAAPDDTPDAAVPSAMLDVTWEAKTIAGKPVGRGIVSSLNIASDLRAGGRGGCNSWFAQAEMNDTGLVFSAVAATRAACLSEAATAQERSFFAALAATRYWQRKGDQLTLLDTKGTVLAVLGKSRY